jgi:hypothetical protein
MDLDAAQSSRASSVRFCAREELAQPFVFLRRGLKTALHSKDEKPSDLTVQLSTKVELLLNLKAAKAIGLALPVSLLGRADEVRSNKGANCCGARVRSWPKADMLNASPNVRFEG